MTFAAQFPPHTAAAPPHKNIPTSGAATRDTEAEVRKCIAGVNINPCAGAGNRKIQFSISFQSMKMIPVYKVQRCDEIEDCVSVLHLSQSQCSILIWDL